MFNQIDPESVVGYVQIDWAVFGLGPNAHFSGAFGMAVLERIPDEAVQNAVEVNLRIDDFGCLAEIGR